MSLNESMNESLLFRYGSFSSVSKIGLALLGFLNGKNSCVTFSTSQLHFRAPVHPVLAPDWHPFFVSSRNASPHMSCFTIQRMAVRA